MDPSITCELARAERVPVEIRRLTGRDDLDALVHRAASGEERAWTLLVGRFDKTIRSLARRYGLSTPDSDEVAQRTWLAVYRHIDRLRSHPAVAGWMTTTARHECLRVLAARKRELPVEEPVDGHEADHAPLDREILEAERREALHRALETVPAARAATDAPDAAGAAAQLRGAQRRAGHPEGQHRPDARALRGPSAPRRGTRERDRGHARGRS